jgi:hypothetical protein
LLTHAQLGRWQILFTTYGFSSRVGKESQMSKNPAVTKQGIVQKIIPSPHPGRPETAEIAVHGADELYKEIRIDNILEDAKGNEVKLKQGAEVDGCRG